MVSIVRRTVLVAAALVGAGLLQPAPLAAAEKVKIVTDAGFLGRHAYFFVAIDKGYYKAADLDVEVLRGQGSADAIKQVASGNVTFGFADAGSLVLARANEGLPVRMVAIVYAKPPHAIYALADSGIRTPKDLEGRKIANPAGGAIPKMFPAYAKAAGIDASKVGWVVASSESLPGLLALGRVDAIGQFTVGAPRLEKDAAPKSVVELSYADAGLDFYGNGLVVSESTLAAKPAVVEAFVAATLKGLRDALADPKAAAETMRKFHRELDADLGAAELVKVKALADVPGVPLGIIQPKQAQATIDVVAGAFDMKSQVRSEDVFDARFVKP
ncbi:ABC transporter substrate-binding protein [Rhodoplanes roseus]|uniref:Thiamine pyrimidine synthase n=1 Tax=Rhodoplanes roseus TaxID=29409 RepID=A0A327L366_9BRAD|nr:ABC transporter substrate-binding protein [Rhodoplanes roseus]RAI44827.1 ABC transporter substrate-binding protein [Rhodoplanes roseus]